MIKKNQSYPCRTQPAKGGFAMVHHAALVICPNCSHHFKARDGNKKPVNAPLYVALALTHYKQECPKCKAKFAAGELANDEVRAIIANAQKRAKPKRRTVT